MGDLLQDTNFWVLVSFVVFLALFFRYGLDSIINMLDQRSQKIRDELDEAEQLRIEAQEMLANYKRKQQNAEEEADRILAEAKDKAKRLVDQAEKELEQAIEKQKKQAEDRIKSAEQKALLDIRREVSDIAIKASEDILKSRLNRIDHDPLVNQSIDQIDEDRLPN
jgi:F-type H+-transporting ATPase subunit b